jgi:Sec-independent protein secretion pathway component TatC
MRAFSGTLVALFVATCFSWVNRTWLFGLWLSPLFEVASRSGADLHVLDPATRGVVTLKTTIATALLLTLPVFSAEVWLLVCQMTRREQARRLTLPFLATSTCAALLALWLARRVGFSSFVMLL